MKKTIILAALLCAPGAAQAADLSSRPVAVVDSGFSWTGIFAGVQGGGEFGTASGPFEFANQTDATPYSIDLNGGLLGGRIGYNWQVNSFVFGVEGDLNAILGAKGSQPNLLSSDTYYYEVHANSTWSADVLARAGVAFDRALLFVDGGIAFGAVTTKYGYTGAPPALSVTTQRVGYALGAGLEYAFTRNIIGSAEYRYTDLGRTSFTDIPFDTYDDVKFTSSAVIVGVAYKF